MMKVTRKDFLFAGAIASLAPSVRAANAQGFAAAVDLAHDMARHDMIRTIREMLDQTAALAPA